MREVVAEAGVAQGTFYLYFSSKEELALALAGDLQDQIGAVLEGSFGRERSAEEMLREGIAEIWALLRGEQALLRTLHCAAGTKLHRQQAVGAAAKLLAQGIQAGDLRADLDPEIAAELLVGLVERSLERQPLREGLQQEQRYLAQLTDFIWAAIRKPEPGAVLK